MSFTPELPAADIVPVELIEKTLDALGETATQVGQTMHSEGVTGVKACEHSCVIANYLARELRGEFHLNSYFGFQFGGGEWFKVPPQVQAFIREFDRGWWPQLEA